MSTETIELTGHDSQGNTVTRTLTVPVAASAGLATETLIGMSSPANMWNQRVADLGAEGVQLGARRIFADLASSALDQIDLVEDALGEGLVPLISYKVGGNITGALSGTFDARAQQAAVRLASYGERIAVSFWHEPNPDIEGDDFVALHRRYLPIFKRGELRVGPILNGWLLDNQVATFDSFVAPDLLAAWDWFGIDTYESGTQASPGPTKPADRMPKLVAYLTGKGKAQIPLVVGEYNGYSAAPIANMGNWLLANPTVWIGCCWNNNGGKGVVLSGDRLAAFRATLADPRLGH